MSFILDALKKSEAERQRQAGPALLEMRVVRPQRRIPAWLIVLGAVLIVVNLGGLVWLLLRPAPAARTASVAAAPAAAAVGVATVAPAASGALPQLAPGERLIGPGGASAPASLATNGNVPPLVGTDDSPVAGDTNPADFLPAEAAPRNARSGAARRNYADVSNAVPPLRLDLHVYDASPTRRYVFINMKQLREGDATADGAKVLEITRDGVVMSYRSTEFLLTSDSSATGGSAAPGADNR
jgi:hypothetical protein